MLRSTRPQGKNTRGGSPLLVKVCPQQRVCSYKAKDGADPLPAVSRIPHHWASAPDPLVLTPGQVPQVWLPPALQLLTCPQGQPHPGAQASRPTHCTEVWRGRRRGVSVVPTPRWRMLKSQEPEPATSLWPQRELTPLGKRTTWLFRVTVKREQKERFTTGVLSGSPQGRGHISPGKHPACRPGLLDNSCPI